MEILGLTIEPGWYRVNDTEGVPEDGWRISHFDGQRWGPSYATLLEASNAPPYQDHCVENALRVVSTIRGSDVLAYTLERRG